MKYTPTLFVNVLRGCSILLGSHQDIEQVLPTAGEGWNDWVWKTVSNSPYLVLKRNGVQFSISRVRTNKEVGWHLLVRWPFPNLNQQKEKVSSSYLVAEVIRRNS